MLGVVVPVALIAFQGVVYGQPVRGTLATLGLLALAFLGRLAWWSRRRDQGHQWEHMWTVAMVDRLQDRLATRDADIDQMRAEIAALREQATPKWPAPDSPLMRPTGLASLLRATRSTNPSYIPPSRRVGPLDGHEMQSE